MNGLEKINNRITEDARAQIREMEAQTAAAASEVRESYRRQAEQLSDDAAAKRKLAVKERLSRLAGSADMERRQMLLGVKQECIGQAFDGAASALRAMPREEYIALLARIAAENGRGDEEIILDADDGDVGAQVVAAANAAKPGASFTLAAERRVLGGGLVLKKGLVEWNCSFATQLDALRQELAPEVARVLFQ